MAAQLVGGVAGGLSRAREQLSASAYRGGIGVLGGTATGVCDCCFCCTCLSNTDASLLMHLVLQIAEQQGQRKENARRPFGDLGQALPEPAPNSASAAPPPNASPAPASFFGS
jgi:hypothetical protein